MKHASFAAVLLALAASLVLVPGTALAQRQVTDFQSLAKAVACSPLPSCAIPERGSISCPSAGVEAAPTLLPPWCPAGSRTKVRDRVMKMWVITSTDERVAGGVITTRFNMNLDTDSFSGHAWGSYLIEVPDRGSWEGMFEGKVDGPTWTYRVVAFGTGEFEGLQMRADGVTQYGVGDSLRGKIATTK